MLGVAELEVYPLAGRLRRHADAGPARQAARAARGLPAGRLRQELVDVGSDRLVDGVLVGSEGEADRSDVAVGEQAGPLEVLQVFLQAPERPGAVVAEAQDLAADASGVLSDAMRFGKEIEVEQADEVREAVVVAVVGRRRQQQQVVAGPESRSASW